MNIIVISLVRTVVVLLVIGGAMSVDAATLNLDGDIGQVKTLPDMSVADKHWGGNSSSEDEFVYEPPPGWIILSFQTHVLSKFGDSWYTPELTSRGSNYVADTQFSEQLDMLEKYAAKYKNKKALAQLRNIRKQSSTWHSAFQSVNNVLRIKWGGASREKKVLGVVVDTDTAALKLAVSITIARSLSKSELRVFVDMLEAKIKSGEGIAGYFSQ